MLYTYKDNVYELMNNGQMKDSSTREWVEAVFYRSVNTGKIYAREKIEFEKLFKPYEHIPYHIQALSKLYPVLDTEGNISKGEIRKFKFTDSDRGRMEKGKRVVSMEFIDNEDYDAIWIHVSNDYFKMIGLWPSPHC